MILALPETLTAHSLQTCLQGHRTTVTDWLARRHDNEPLHLDLSRVQEAEFGALAQTLLILEACARSGVRLRIDLPSPVPPGHGQATWQAHQAALRRSRCRQFLVMTGFVSASLMPHLPDSDVDLVNLPVGHQPPASRDRSATRVPLSTDEHFDRTAPSPNIDSVPVQPRILTFRWLAPERGAHLWRSDGLVGVIRGLREIGLSQRDAQLLGNNVLFEVVDNVAAHAGDDQSPCPPHALVGALALDATAPPRSDLTHPELRELLDWSEGARGTVVYIVVGDSGVGLVDRLAPHAPPDMSEPDQAGADASWTEPEWVSLWALTRWSTSSKSRGDATRGTRGLWRMERAIRSYGGGALLVRTCAAAAGHRFRGKQSTAVRISGANAAPGTLLDVLVTTAAPAGSAVGRPATPVAHGSAATPGTAGAVSLQRVRFGAESTDGDAFDTVREHVRAGRNVVCTVDGGSTLNLSHRRLVSILATAGELAAQAIIVVLVTGADPVAVDAGVDALHHPEPSVLANPGSPFLVIDGTGAGRWCGGQAAVRTLLTSLLDGPLRPAGHVAEAEVRALPAGQPHLVRYEAEAVHLTVQPADVAEQLERATAADLRAAVRRAGPGVLLGAFRTPNLTITNRWIDVDRIVEDTTGAGVAAYLLAQKLAVRVPDAVLRDTQLVQISTVIRDLALMVAQSARLPGGVPQMIDGADLLSAVHRSVVGRNIVLCADILLTENSATNALRDILARRAVPVALVVPFDARGHDGPVTVHGVKVPVLSLARLPRAGSPTGDGPVIDIDPVLRRPVVTIGPHDKPYRWSPEVFLRSCAELPSVVGLGHLVRPAARHFTAYFDASRIVDSSSRLREQIAAEMHACVEGWLRERPGGPRSAQPDVVVCHAGSQDGYARRLAELVARRLGRSGTVGPVRPPIQVSRGVDGSRYAFPNAMELPTGSDVIIVDWGSFDATTLLQLIRLAAEGGARRIFAVVLLSQLNQHDERALTMMRSVAGRAGDDSPVDTKITFLTAMGITPVAAGDCGLCETAQTLRTAAQDATMPRELVDHAVSLATSLRAMTRDEIAGRRVDAFGAPVSPEEAIEYIRLRTMLLAGLRSPQRADQVAEHLAALADRPQDPRGHAVIRLLAAEQQWLRLLPLRLTTCLADVARLATAIARDGGPHELLRLQAVLVLANAAPEGLIRRLDLLWTSAAQHDELLLQLAYQVWVLARPDSYRSGVRLTEFRQRLTACRALGNDDYLSPDRAEDMRNLLSRLLTAIDHSEIGGLRLTTQEAWARLRNRYLFSLDRHPDAETAAINLLVFTEDVPPPGGVDDSSWQTLARNWHTMATFLQNEVLPFTPALGNVLKGAFVQEHSTTAHRPSLQRLASPAAVQDLAALESQIHGFKRTSMDYQSFVDSWHRMRQRVFEWRHTVFTTGGGQFPRASLALLLDGCPARLGTVITDAVTSTRAQGLPVAIRLCNNGWQNLAVFCHRDLLDSAIQQLINNTVKPSHRRPGHENAVVNLDITVDVNATMVRIRFQNDHTVAGTATGNGLSSMRRKLKDFGATLTPAPVPADGWTYEIDLALEVWPSTEGGGT